jgi:serine protease AprX
LNEILSGAASDDRINVIITARFFEKSLLAELLSRPTVMLRHVVKMTNMIALSASPEQIKSISHEPWVEKIEEDQIVYAVIDESAPAIGAPVAWRAGFTGRGVSIAVIDTGIDANHPDFAGRLVAIRDFTMEAFSDSNGHGSLVAGIAAGTGAYSGGMYKGIAPDALIMSAKVLKADGSGLMSDVIAAVEWATEYGANIINLSLGTCTPSDGDDALCVACNHVVEMGVVVCAAAGNDGPNKRTVGSPGAARRVITVGAVTASGNVAEFSSRGPVGDDRMKPEIVAPGTDIISVRAHGTRAGKPLDHYYTSATGTSMATPHISGIVAILLEANRKASPQLIRESLYHTAIDLSLEEYSQGAGMVAAFDALRYVQTHENPAEALEKAPTRSAFFSMVSALFDSVTKHNKKKRVRREPLAIPAARASFDFDNFDKEDTFFDEDAVPRDITMDRSMDRSAERERA